MFRQCLVKGVSIKYCEVMLANVELQNMHVVRLTGAFLQLFIYNVARCVKT